MPRNTTAERTPDRTPDREDADAFRAKGKAPPNTLGVYLHRRGYYCKKHKGLEHRLGRDWPKARAFAASMIADPTASPAFDDDARSVRPGMTVRGVVDAFVAEKNREHEEGSCSPATVYLYRAQLSRFAKIVRPDRAVSSLKPDDFDRVMREARRRGVGAASKTVTYVRAAFNWARKRGLIEREPFYGGAFDKPKALEIRRMRNARQADQGEAAWTPAELLELLAGVSPILRAAILLALNGGFSNADISGLDERHIRWGDWQIHFARVKTEIPRIVPLWPMTMVAVAQARALRPKPALRAHAGRIFLTETGNPVSRYSVKLDTRGVSGAARVDRLSDWFSEACKALGLWRPGRGFGSLRAAFRSLAIGQPRELVELLMGHNLSGLDPFYVRGMQSRLVEVTEHVRRSLFDQSQMESVRIPRRIDRGVTEALPAETARAD